MSARKRNLRQRKSSDVNTFTNTTPKKPVKKKRKKVNTKNSQNIEGKTNNLVPSKESPHMKHLK